MNSRRDFTECEPLMKLYDAPLMEIYNHEDYNTIKSIISELQRIKNYFKIVEVKKVNNPQLYGMYLLHKEESQNIYGRVTEHMLFHATSREKIDNITKNNLDWRKTKRSRFGRGVCFSSCPYYADKYAGSHGAFVLAKVLTNSIQRTGVCYGIKIPSDDNCDTTSNKKVFVKYDDYTFYPEFVVYYINNV